MGRKPKTPPPPPPKPKRKKPGQPPFVPTPDQRKQVQMLAGFGNTQDQISVITGIAVRTISRHFPQEMKNGAAVVNSVVAQRLFLRTEKDTTAGIFWMKARAGWVDRPESNVIGVVDLEKLLANAHKKANGGK